MATMVESPPRQKPIITFYILFAFSRLFLLFIPAILQDISFLTVEDEYWTSPEITVPLIYTLEVMSFHRLFGFSLVGVRLGMVLVDTLCLFFFYKLSFLFQTKEQKRSPEKSRENSLIIILIFAFFPPTLFNYVGMPENLTTLFLILGLYYYLRDKYALSGLFFSLGFQTEFYPIFCVVPILIQLLLRKEYKNIIKMVATLIIPFVLLEMPFFILDPTNFLKNYFIQFSRSPTSLSLWQPIYANTPVWNVISIGGFLNISLVGLTFGGFFISYIVILFIYFRKYKRSSKSEVLAFMSIFLLLFPLIFLSIFTRYLYFALPLICLQINSRDDFRTNVKRARFITVLLLPISLTTLILWPNLLIFQVPELVTTIDNPTIYFILFLALFILSSLLWIRIGNRYYYNENFIEEPSTISFLPLAIIMMTIQMILESYGLVYVIVFYLFGMIWILWTLLRIKKSSLNPIFRGSAIKDLISKR